jgi:hypothetical protein
MLTADLAQAAQSAVGWLNLAVPISAMSGSVLRGGHDAMWIARTESATYCLHTRVELGIPCWSLGEAISESQLHHHKAPSLAGGCTSSAQNPMPQPTTPAEEGLESCLNVKNVLVSGEVK